MGKTLEQYLEQVYYSLDSPASYAGIRRVFEEARRKFPKLTMQDLHEFMDKQRVYTMHYPARKRFPD